MMRTIQYSFPSKADGLEISCLAVVPELGRDEKYKGIIQIVHGMSEYKERYLPFMEYMAERKYVSVIHDHRGHGKSVRSKEDLGYMYGGGADAMLQDIHTVNCLIRDHFPELPLILFGHSMGSLAVRAYAAHHDGCMDILQHGICSTAVHISQVFFAPHTLSVATVIMDHTYIFPFCHIFHKRKITFLIFTHSVNNLDDPTVLLVTSQFRHHCQTGNFQSVCF